MFKSYGLVSYKVDAYKKNKYLCFNFRHVCFERPEGRYFDKISPKKVKLKVKQEPQDADKYFLYNCQNNEN